MSIDKLTEQKILSAAKVADVLREHGVQLTPRGRQLLGLCPFHEDRSLGSFVVNERDNYYKCFACGAKGDAVTVLKEMDKMTYPEALRYLAAMYNIYIDDAPAPKVIKKYEPRQPLPPTTMLYWQLEILKPYLHQADQNPLLTWMLSLPMQDEHKKQLKNLIEIYAVGTSLKGKTSGWTMFPQIDMEMRVRDIKFMAYKSDGHRNKELPRSFNWMHSMLEKAGKFDSSKYHVEHCLFGLHLAKIYPDAEVCLVESEKSAIICSAFSDPTQKIWMATGGKSGLTPEAIAPLVEQNRYIVLYPDYDGYKEWTERANALDYPRLTISNNPIELHIASDGDKADIADMMVRIIKGVTESPAEIAARRLGAPDKAEDINYLIEKLDLQITN